MGKYYRRRRLKTCAAEGVTAIVLGGYIGGLGYREWIAFRYERLDRHSAGAPANV